MFSFFKSSKSKQEDFSFLGTDMHSHVIAGIDDGARTMDESLVLIRNLQRMGFSKLITTPHTFKEYYPNTPQTIDIALTALKLEDQLLCSRVEAASEYYGDEYFLSLLENEDKILTFGENYVLFEVSMLAESVLLPQLLFQLKTKGYQPVLAHPERYLYYLNKRKTVFHSFECDLQVNLLSLGGYYGKRQKDLGLYLIENDLVDFLGTDIHHQQQLPYLEKVLKNRKVMKLLNSKQFKNIQL